MPDVDVPLPEVDSDEADPDFDESSDGESDSEVEAPATPSLQQLIDERLDGDLLLTYFEEPALDDIELVSSEDDEPASALSRGVSAAAPVLGQPADQPVSLGGPARHTRAQAPLPPEVTLEELEAVLNYDDEELQAQADLEWEQFLEAVQAPCLDDVEAEEDEVDSDFELDLDALVGDSANKEALQAEGLAHIPETRMRARLQQQQQSGHALGCPAIWPPITQPAVNTSDNSWPNVCSSGKSLPFSSSGSSGSNSMSNMQVAALHLQCAQHVQLLMQGLVGLASSGHRICQASQQVICLAAELVQFRSSQQRRRQVSGLQPFPHEVLALPQALSPAAAFVGLPSAEQPLASCVLDTMLLRHLPEVLATYSTTQQLASIVSAAQLPDGFDTTAFQQPLKSIMQNLMPILDMRLTDSPQAATTQAPSMLWTAGEDAVLALGIRRMGQTSYDAIAAAMLPPWNSSQVRDRIKHMSHHNKAPNIVKAAVEAVTGPLQDWEVDAVQNQLDTTYRGRVGGGHIMTAWWRAIVRDCLPHREHLNLKQMWQGRKKQLRAVHPSGLQAPSASGGRAPPMLPIPPEQARSHPGRLDIRPALVPPLQKDASCHIPGLAARQPDAVAEGLQRRPRNLLSAALRVGTSEPGLCEPEMVSPQDKCTSSLTNDSSPSSGLHSEGNANAASSPNAPTAKSESVTATGQSTVCSSHSPQGNRRGSDVRTIQVATHQAVLAASRQPNAPSALPASRVNQTTATSLSPTGRAKQAASKASPAKPPAKTADDSNCGRRPKFGKTSPKKRRIVGSPASRRAPWSSRASGSPAHQRHCSLDHLAAVALDGGSLPHYSSQSSELHGVSPDRSKLVPSQIASSPTLNASPKSPSASAHAVKWSAVPAPLTNHRPGLSSSAAMASLPVESPSDLTASVPEDDAASPPREQHPPSVNTSAAPTPSPNPRSPAASDLKATADEQPQPAATSLDRAIQLDHISTPSPATLCSRPSQATTSLPPARNNNGTNAVQLPVFESGELSSSSEEEPCAFIGPTTSAATATTALIPLENSVPSEPSREPIAPLAPPFSIAAPESTVSRQTTPPATGIAATPPIVFEEAELTDSDDTESDDMSSRRHPRFAPGSAAVVASAPAAASPAEVQIQSSEPAAAYMPVLPAVGSRPCTDATGSSSVLGLAAGGHVTFEEDELTDSDASEPSGPEKPTSHHQRQPDKLLCFCGMQCRQPSNVPSFEVDVLSDTDSSVISVASETPQSPISAPARPAKQQPMSTLQSLPTTVEPPVGKSYESLNLKRGAQPCFMLPAYKRPCGVPGQE